MSEQPSQFPPPQEPFAPDMQNMGGFPPAQGQQPYQGYAPYPQQQYPPGAWPGQQQYMPMPVPKPPSPLTDPKALTEKLPLAALVVLCGFGFAGLLQLLSGFFGTGYGSSGAVVTSGIAMFVAYCMYGIVGFAVLMSLKYVIDLKNAKAEAAAAKEAAEAAGEDEQ